MIRTKVTLVFFVIVALLGAASVGLVHSEFSQPLRDSAQTQLRRSANIAEQSIRLDEATLLARANLVAGSDALHKAMTGEAATPEADDQAEPLPNQPSVVEKRHLAVHEKLDAQRYRLEDIYKAAGNRRGLELGVLERRPHEHEIFVALDVKGEGVAALGKDLYSWFGEDVAKNYPSVREVAKTGVPRVEYWMWSFGQSQEKRPYRVAIAPIRRSETDSTAGVVVLGTMLNDGVARGKQRLVAGVAEEDRDADLSLAPQFVMFRGKTVIGSTFDAALQKAVAAEFERVGGFNADSAAILDVKLGETPYYAMVRSFAGEGNDAMGVAVLTDVDAALAGIKNVTNSIIATFLVFTLLGVGLLFFVILRWIRPLEELEDGMQEVIAGNKDFTWTPLEDHSLQTSMAQSLNLMSAFLQGKSMNDEEGGGSWGADMEDVSAAPAPRIQGVALPMMQAPPKKED